MDPEAIRRGMKAAIRRAAAREGHAGVECNYGAAVARADDGRWIARATTDVEPAWSLALRAAERVGGGSTLCLSGWFESPRALVRALRRAGVVAVHVGTCDRQKTLKDSLARAGIETSFADGPLRRDAEEVHRKWSFSRRHGRPFVTLKGATSLDGAVATATGHSKWITGAEARREAHRLRSRHAAIAVGVGTVLADDPGLDVRLVKGRSPRPVVFDTHLRMLDRRHHLQLHRPGVVVLHGRGAARERLERATALGMVPMRVRTRGGRLDAADALDKLLGLGLSSLMVEGGGQLLSSFVRADLFEELWLFQAPVLLGGAARPLLPDLDWSTVDQGPALDVITRRALGRDLLWVCARPDSRAPH